MAVLCLAENLSDLKERLGRMVIGYTRERKPIYAADLKAEGALTLLLKDALNPNLVQTLEGGPALVHGGPFGNIAHGTNSIKATRLALKLGDFALVETGFGTDLGFEKFCNIVARQTGLVPDAAVIVASARALKLHGGAHKNNLATEDVSAVRAGMPNLLRHVENVRRFGVPALAAINIFPTDTNAEVRAIEEELAAANVATARSDIFMRGGEGGVEMASALISLLEDQQTKGSDGHSHTFHQLYPDDLPLHKKIEVIATQVYGAEWVDFIGSSRRDLERYEALGYGHLPICMAKTQYSFTDEPARLNAPLGFQISVRSARLSAGAGFVVALTGDIMTMPGLGRTPAAEHIDVEPDGRVIGLS
jgi:formate--tetrahydrofolate ligase